MTTLIAIGGSLSSNMRLWLDFVILSIEQLLNPFPAAGDLNARPSGPSALRPAVGSAPGAARTRPMAPRDRGSIRKVAVSGLGCRFGRPGFEFTFKIWSAGSTRQRLPRD